DFPTTWFISRPPRRYGSWRSHTTDESRAIGSRALSGEAAVASGREDRSQTNPARFPRARDERRSALAKVPSRACSSWDRRRLGALGTDDKNNVRPPEGVDSTEDHSTA